MSYKKRYFEIQISMDNMKEYEIYCSATSNTNPQFLCDWLCIDLDVYIENGLKFNGIYKDESNSYCLYPTIKFINKSDARKFIKEYLNELLFLPTLMGTINQEHYY